jgi:TPP-dependent pyruvate/acetoin dehydrogenase alpha subunit
MPGVIVDGNDLFAVYGAARAAMERARSGAGPTLIECKTYRFRPHSNADDDRKYRSEAEVAEWRARDPITRLERYVLDRKLASEAQLADMRRALESEVEQAIAEAEQAPAPAPGSLFEHLYASLGDR